MDNLSTAIAGKFQFNLANTSGTTKKVAILPAFYDTLANVAATTATGDPLVYTTLVTITNTSKTALNAAGYDVDAVLDDGTILPGLVATAGNSKFSIRSFLNYIRFNRRLCNQLQIKASNKDQFDKQLEISSPSPFYQAKVDYIDLTKFRNVMAQQDDLIMVDFFADGGQGLMIGSDTYMALQVDTGRSLTVTIYVK